MESAGYTRYHQQNTIERHRYGGAGWLVWGGFILGSRTDLHVQSVTMTGRIYRDVILEQHVRLFRGAMGAEFLFMDDNARPHCANIVDECLQSEDITRMDWPAYSPDLNPIKHVWDMLGRRIAVHQPPPTCLPELRRALLDEWCNIPQDQIDNLILSMPRRLEVRADLPVPKILYEDEVLLKVIAAGVDNMDLLVTKGHGRAIRSHLRRNNGHIEDHSMIILGRECSGIVLKTGKNVTCVTKGDEVWAVSAYCLEGLMAEYVVVKDTQVALKPQNLTFEEAASLPYTSIQVCNALLNQASLNSKSAKGKRILLITGNSPVGLFAMQLLKSWGGVVTTAVPTAGLPMCHELGADDVIVYSVTDFETELRNRKR
ncbi:reticulon-4-interacting protein 1 homolog, mitochondrial [Trichonephila clavipes]|uniref:Reticulon-4-interacting protein 1 homolog, mitochondrial n=1 Tax=Trichonephila clavipes TaxID=2585209 RepID=A0A8X6W5I5_TRICX|nr:reticulon-4-interacting protein 1 homolog, mitochondrial [Trichonephila clavipes]